LSKLHYDNDTLDKNKTYITCCSHGLRSIKAVTLLKEHGYDSIFNGGSWIDLEKTIKQVKEND